jgi:hypothetical protein
MKSNKRNYKDNELMQHLVETVKALSYLTNVHSTSLMNIKPPNIFIGDKG